MSTGLAALDRYPKPHENAIRIAIGHAMLSPCQSKRGAAIFEGRLVYASGHNEQVNPFECDGSDECKRTCRHSAIHAEQAALIRAGLFAQGRSMLHVKVVDGALVPSGPPSCPACSRLIVAAGILSVWLFHKSGWKKYTAVDFHRLSVSASIPPAGAQGETQAEEIARLRGEVQFHKDECAEAERDRDCLNESMTEEIARLRVEHERAMKVLNPNVPESGLEDACRQVKQAAISAADNCEELESQVQALQAQLAEAQQAARITRREIAEAHLTCHQCGGGIGEAGRCVECDECEASLRAQLSEAQQRIETLSKLEAR